ncbi:ATP-binding cassette sub-family D member 4, partial [Armadillidium nasatum]
NSFLCMSLMFSFSQLVDLTSSVVELSGVTHRVSQLIEKLNELQVEWDLQELQVSSSFSNLTKNRYGSRKFPTSEEERREILHENGNGEISLALRDEQPINIAFIFNNVTITPPESDRILVKELTLEITRQNHLLVMGPSSSGKSSLLRVIRGLWTSKEGSVGHNLPPGPKAVIFLPQKPIMTNGSLYEQIIYPLRLDKNNPPSEETLQEILKTIDELLLHGLVERCGGLLNDPHWRW